MDGAWCGTLGKWVIKVEGYFSICTVEKHSARSDHYHISVFPSFKFVFLFSSVCYQLITRSSYSFSIWCFSILFLFPVEIDRFVDLRLSFSSYVHFCKMTSSFRAYYIRMLSKLLLFASIFVVVWFTLFSSCQFNMGFMAYNLLSNSCWFVMEELSVVDNTYFLL